jgi:hypothetical protein
MRTLVNALLILFLQCVGRLFVLHVLFAVAGGETLVPVSLPGV